MSLYLPQCRTCHRTKKPIGKCGKRKFGVRIESPLGYDRTNWCWDCYQEDLRAMLKGMETKQ